MPKPLDPYAGVFRLGTDLTLSDIWTGLHSDAQMWRRAAFAADTLRQRAAINDNTSALLSVLATCPALRWQAFVDAQGVTQIGAMALSWCEGADIRVVANLFLGNVKRASDVDQQAANHQNPALLPATRSVSELASVAKNDVKSLVLMSLAQPSPLIFDVPDTWLKGLPVIVGAIFLERYDPSTSDIAPDIIAKWKDAT